VIAPRSVEVDGVPLRGERLGERCVVRVVLLVERARDGRRDGPCLVAGIQDRSDEAVDAREARMVGQVAVQLSKDEKNREGSVAMIRKPGDRYEIETIFTSIKNVARETKHMDAAYIRNGNDITEAFKAYAAPIVGPLPVVGTLDELKR